MEAQPPEREIEKLLAENSQLKQRLDQALAAAVSANEELQAFVYAASHDLKEPLRSISSYTQLLQRQFPQTGDAAEYSKFIIDGVNTAASLIEQLLKLSRAGSSPRRSTVDLAAPIQVAIFKLQSLLERSGGQVSYRNLPEATVDEEQFVQLFESLIENAIKYRGTAVPKVEISVEQRDDHHVVSVSDNGVGIDSAYFKQVFLPFKRLHGKEIPGAGLGLAMARKIVEAHEGKIWIESDGSSGSVFKIALPY